MVNDILTVPKEAETYRTVLATGNEVLSFPEVNPKDGGIMSATVLHMGSVGLLEFAGKEGRPLIRPYWKVDGKPLDVKMTWSYRQYWLPSFTARVGALSVRGTIFAPPGHRGAVYLVRMKNTGKSPVQAEAGFVVEYGGLNHHVFRQRSVETGVRCTYDHWTKSLVLEVGNSLPLAALAFGLDLDGPWWQRPVGEGSCCADAAKVVTLNQGEELVVPLYIGVNIEGSGAGTTVVDLRRHGWPALLAQTESWLKKRIIRLTEYERVANRNLFFTYFFALGRTIDTDDWVPVTSRSPRYYVSAAFWSRDTLLWSFPGLLLAEPSAAREVLLAVFKRHLERAGEHAHYINGVLLYPGYELDQLAAYILALRNYLDRTYDSSVLDEDVVRRALPVLAAKLLDCRDKTHGLCTTFLDPSDDPVRYPFLVYGNALAQQACVFLGTLQNEGWGLPTDFTAMAEELRQSIYHLGVVDGPFGPMFAWAVDGEGNAQYYDNPPGSLQLLPYYGFCEREDPVWQNTVKWIHSTHNPYYRESGKIKGVASRHAGNPWPLAAANDLLGLNMDEGMFFKQAVMDGGFCCETVHPSTGRASTGHGFASAAGFIANALWYRYKR
jgi:hypothetical protein